MPNRPERWPSCGVFAVAETVVNVFHPPFAGETLAIGGWFVNRWKNGGFWPSTRRWKCLPWSTNWTAGGIYSEFADIARLDNTIVADGLYGSFDSAGSHNLIRVIDGSTGIAGGSGTLYGTAADF